MSTPRPRRSRALPARLATCLSIVVMGSACASWHVLDGPPEQVMAGERPQKVRVTYDDGTQTVLMRPRVLGSVLAGFEADCIERWGYNEAQCPETGVPVYQIERVEVEKRGAASLLLPAAGGLLAAWLLANR